MLAGDEMDVSSYWQLALIVMRNGEAMTLKTVGLWQLVFLAMVLHCFVYREMEAVPRVNAALR